MLFLRPILFVFAICTGLGAFSAAKAATISLHYEIDPLTEGSLNGSGSMYSYEDVSKADILLAVGDTVTVSYTFVGAFVRVSGEGTVTALLSNNIETSCEWFTITSISLALKFADGSEEQFSSPEQTDGCVAIGPYFHLSSTVREVQSILVNYSISDWTTPSQFVEGPMFSLSGPDSSVPSVAIVARHFVPEPGTLALLCLGLVGLSWSRRRKAS